MSQVAAIIMFYLCNDVTAKYLPLRWTSDLNLQKDMARVMGTLLGPFICKSALNDEVVRGAANKLFISLVMCQKEKYAQQMLHPGVMQVELQLQLGL